MTTLQKTLITVLLVAAVGAGISETRQASTAQSHSFGPVIERVIDLSNKNYRALNLASGNFMTPSRGREFIFRADQADTLRVADVDLYFADDAPALDNLNTLDMRLVVEASPHGTNAPPITLDTISATQARLVLEQLGALRSTMLKDGLFGFDLRKVEPVLRGTNLHVFVTRDGTEGALQIVGRNKQGVKIRYKLVQTRDERFAIPFLSAQQRVAVITEAHKAFTNFVQSDRKERDGDNIPKKFWGDAILNLKPLRVVNDRVNIKIVLANDGRVEAGFYVNLPISSFAPQPESFLEFVQLSQPDDKAFGSLYRYKLVR